MLKQMQLQLLLHAIVGKATFNGVSLLGASAVSTNIGVTDDGGTVALKTTDGITAITAITRAHKC